MLIPACCLLHVLTTGGDGPHRRAVLGPRVPRQELLDEDAGRLTPRAAVARRLHPPETV